MLLGVYGGEPDADWAAVSCGWAMKSLGLLFAMSATTFLRAQSSPTFIDHATIAYQNGMVVVHASSPRPVEQAASAIRREFGFILDYEEGPSDQNSRFTWIGNQKRWKGGDYLLRLPKPDTSAPKHALRLVEDMLAQFASDGEPNFTVIDGPNNRITITPADSGARILDTPISIPPQQRTIEETIEAIGSAITARTGFRIERGGLADNELASRQVTVGNLRPVPARDLLEETLDHTMFRRYWILGWEPSTFTYAINIQTVVKLVRTPGGETRETPVH